MKTKILCAIIILFCSCSSSDPNENNKVAIELTNNLFSPDETLELYKNQDLKILDINKCKGSPEVGNGLTCTSGTSDFGVYYRTETDAAGDTLPDTTLFNGIVPGFYWASFLFYRNDPDNGCQISAANGVFEIKSSQTVNTTLELGIPHSCDFNPCNTGQTACDGLCVELNTDDDNCGACGNECTGGESCTAGDCI